MSSPSHVPPPLFATSAEPAQAARAVAGELAARTSFSPMGTLSGISDPLIRPHWSTDGRWLAAPSQAGTIAVWDMADLALGELSFFSIYARVISSGESGPVALTPVHVPRVGFAFSAGARILYVPVDDDQAASLLGEHDGDITALGSNHRYVASLGADTLRIWDPLASSMQRTSAAFALDRPGCRDLAWATGSDRIAVAGDGGVTIFDPRHPGAPVHVGIDDAVGCLAWSARGNVLAAGTHGGDIYVWERESGRAHAWHGHVAPVSGVAFSCDGTLLASTSASGDMLIWTVADGSKRHEIPEEVSALGRAPSTGLAFHPRANVLATIDSYDQLTVRLWSARVDESRTRVPDPAGPGIPEDAGARPGDDGAGDGDARVAATPERDRPGVRWQHVAPLLEPGRAARPPAGNERGGRGLRWQHVAPAAVDVDRESSSRISVPASAARDPATPVEIAAEDLRAHVAATGLLQPARVTMQIAAALNAGKHVLLLGLPGTGKTTLARAVADFAARAGLCGTPLSTAASAEWTPRDILGGPVPLERHGAGRGPATGFAPGLILRAMSAGRWLVIDALDRADCEAAFGDLLTVMAGHPVELPYQVAGVPVRILPHRRGADDFPGTLAGDLGAYVIHPNWRLLATVNVAGQPRTSPLSPVLMRHFAVIDVPPPEPPLFRQLVDRWLADAGSGLPAGLGAGLGAAFERLLSPDMPLMRRRPLGPAVVHDMIAYVVERARMGPEPADALLGEAFLAHGAAQLEGLGRDDLLAIHRHLTTAVFPGTPAARLLDARMRALHPEIPSGAWSDW
jgi:WD40 repeat protein/MoxR-like ATPase